MASSEARPARASVGRVRGRSATVAGLVLAPLHALERVRGRRRLALVGAYLVVAALLGLLAWRATRLAGLPDVGDPFDPAELLARDVPEGRNAFVLYAQAVAAARRDSGVERRLLGAPYAWPKPGDAAALDYLAANGPALRLWRQATERPDALIVRPRDLGVDTDLGLLNVHRHFTRLALLHAARDLTAGDPAGAWDWYAATLRASAHAGRNGPVFARLVGIAELGAAVGPILHWAADPRVDAALLRRALDEVKAFDAALPPGSETLKIDYLMVRHDFDDPGRLTARFVEELDQADTRTHLIPWGPLWFAENEPERTRRLTRLAYANWLAHADAPASARPALVEPGGFYASAPAGTPAAAMSGRELGNRVAGSVLARRYLASLGGFIKGLDRERAYRGSLLVGLADQLYTRERGSPPRRFADLVGPYLDRLPDGHGDDDAPPSAFPSTGDTAR